MSETLVRCRRCGQHSLRSACTCSRYFVAVEEWDLTHDWKDGKRVPGSERLEFREQWAHSAVEAAQRSVDARDVDERRVLEDPVHAVVVTGYPFETAVLRMRVRAAAVIEYWAAPAPEESPLAVPDYRKKGRAEIEAAIGLS